MVNTFILILPHFVNYSAIKYEALSLTYSWFSLCLFRTMEYISGQANFLPHHPLLLSFQLLRLLFYMLNYNVPLCLTLTQNLSANQVNGDYSICALAPQKEGL